MSRRSISTGYLVLGPVPKRMHSRQESGATAGHGVLAAGFEDARAKRAVSARGVARVLHRQQHHNIRSMCKLNIFIY